MTLVDNRDHPKQFALTSYGIVQQTIINIRDKIPYMRDVISVEGLYTT